MGFSGLDCGLLMVLDVFGGFKWCFMAWIVAFEVFFHLREVRKARLWFVFLCSRLA